MPINSSSKLARIKRSQPFMMRSGNSKLPKIKKTNYGNFVANLPPSFKTLSGPRCVCVCGGGGGVSNVSALISTITNFLDVHGKATISGDFSPNLLENKLLCVKCFCQWYYWLLWQHSF